MRFQLLHKAKPARIFRTFSGVFVLALISASCSDSSATSAEHCDVADCQGSVLDAAADSELRPEDTGNVDEFVAAHTIPWPSADVFERLRVPCRFLLPDDAVPVENADSPDSDTVWCLDIVHPEDGMGVHVAVFAPATRLPSLLPVVVLQGGPGLLGDSWLPFQSAAIRAARFGSHPWIYVEQRGIGQALPSLTCEPGEPLVTCAEERGIRLSRLGSDLAAEDILLVLDALEQDATLLAAGSYGTRLAAEVARQAPDRVAGMYLESWIPPDESFLVPMAEATANTWRSLVESCEADPQCPVVAPAETLARAVERLEQPALVILPSGGRLTPRVLGQLLIEAMYHADWLPGILTALDGLAGTDEERFIESVETFDEWRRRPPQVTAARYQATACTDFAFIHSAEQFQLALNELQEPLRSTVAGFSALFAPCEPLGIEPIGAEATRIGDYGGPVRLLVPGWDSRSGESRAAELLLRWPQTQRVDAPRRAHTPGLGFQDEGRTPDPCAMSQLRTFLDDPLSEPLTCWDDGMNP